MTIKLQVLIALLITANLFSTGCMRNGSISNRVNAGHFRGFKEFIPEDIANLPENFYPAGLTRHEILENISFGVKKTGQIEDDTWSDVILVTGDLWVGNLTIEPGTIVLIEADKDDQHHGEDNTRDPVNPHEFLGRNYSRDHISIWVNERLIAKGTPEKPIIITSTAENPGLADWDHFSLKKGTLEYAVVEHCWGINIDSSDVTVSHCVIRNVLQQGLLFGRWIEAGIRGEGSLSPNITYNYMYNFGHMAVQSFFFRALYCP